MLASIVELSLKVAGVLSPSRGEGMIEEMGCISGNTDRGKGVAGMNTDAGNGSTDVENGRFIGGNSSASSQESLKTYKRRRNTTKNSSEIQPLENGTTDVDTFRQLPKKRKLKEPGDTVSLNFSDDVYSDSDDSFLNNSRNNVLNQPYPTPSQTEGGLLGRIKDKMSLHSFKHIDKCPSLPGGTIVRSNKSAKGPLAVSCNDFPCKSSRSNTDSCRQVFRDVVGSEMFSQLNDLLLTNFGGAKIESIRHINSSIKEGAYDLSPVRFHSDMQKAWEHLQKVGAEIETLAKSLMDKSKASCSQQFPESDLDTKVEQKVACVDPKGCSCRQCGEKADGKDCLVCDSCEEMYHISCIQPAVEEIPTKSWYCTNCVAIGIGSPHDNCVVCEKLIATIPPNNGVDYQELDLECKWNSDGLSNHEIELQKGGNMCNICKTEILSDKNIKVCGHPFCIHRYYHMNCLTNKQLSKYGPCWYCPSCLCRACLTDKDDNEIVMCDGCDHAYHIYCMQPSLTAIPEGKWFCMKCDVVIQKITKAKMEHESKVNKSGEDGKGKGIGVVGEEVGGKSGGMDMLLSAARTLKYKEKMAADQTES